MVNYCRNKWDWKEIKMNQQKRMETAHWINSIDSNDSIRVDFSKIKMGKRTPTSQDIIGISKGLIWSINHDYFGRYNKESDLKGICFIEGSMSEEGHHPHFVLFKPVETSMDEFRNKLKKIISRMNTSDYRIPIDSDLSAKRKKWIGCRGFDGFAKVTEKHCKSGDYLTKDFNVKVYAMKDRGRYMENDEMNDERSHTCWNRK